MDKRQMLEGRKLKVQMGKCVVISFVKMLKGYAVRYKTIWEKA